MKLKFKLLDPGATARGKAGGDHRVEVFRSSPVNSVCGLMVQEPEAAQFQLTENFMNNFLPVMGNQHGSALGPSCCFHFQYLSR